jgi:hypothetical protein
MGQCSTRFTEVAAQSGLLRGINFWIAHGHLLVRSNERFRGRFQRETPSGCFFVSSIREWRGTRRGDMLAALALAGLHSQRLGQRRFEGHRRRDIETLRCVGEA